MRSCIYCGKDLEKDELCNCHGAINRRNSQSQSTSSNSNQSTGNHNHFHKNNSNSYHTGYTKRENPFKSAWNRYTTRKNAARSHFDNIKKTPRRNIFFDTLSFFKSPVTTVSNTSHMNIGFVLVIAALAGALIGLCSYLILLSFIHTGVSFVGNSVISVGIFSNTEILAGLAAALLSGAIIGLIVYLVYCASFYLVNRLIFRDSTSFKDFFISLSLCPLPLAVSGVFGLIFGLISLTTLAIIIFCGTIFTVILTYEVLKIKWTYYSQNQILYGTIFGFFVLGLIVSSLIPII